MLPDSSKSLSDKVGAVHNVDYDYFSNLLSTIKRKFKKAFGKNLADKTVIQKDNDYEGFGLIVIPNSIDLDS